MQFKFFLALELGMTVKQLCETMDVVEFHQWGKYYANKARNEQRAAEDAKNRIRKR